MKIQLRHCRTSSHCDKLIIVILKINFVLLSPHFVLDSVAKMLNKNTGNIMGQLELPNV